MKFIFLFIILFIFLVDSSAINETLEQLSPLDLNTIAISDTIAYVDSIVTLQIDVDNCEEFVAFQVDLILPDGLDFIEDSEQLTSRAQDHLIQANYVGEDTLRIISFSMNSLPFNGDSGAVAYIEFHVNLDEGLYPLILENGLLANVNSENILDEMINGQLEVLPVTSSYQENIVPLKFTVSKNYPNPFNPTTKIDYALPTESDVVLSIYNIKGQLVKRIKHENQPAGYHQIVWQGRNDNNRRVASGVYFYRLKAGKHQKIKKMLLLK